MVASTRKLNSAYELPGGSFGLDAPAEISASPKFDDSRLALTIPFAASLGRDRQGDFLEVSGIQTENHRKLPNAFLDHGLHHHLPIGRCSEENGDYTVTIDDQSGIAWAKIYLSKAFPLLAEQLYQLWKDGIMKAGSIGYRPMKVTPLPPDPSKGILKKGAHIEECELLEVSLVGLPANGDCVAGALAGMWAGKSLLAPLREALLPYAPRTKSITVPTNYDATPAVDETPALHVEKSMPDTTEVETSPANTDKVPKSAQHMADMHGVLGMAKAMMADGMSEIEHPEMHKCYKKLSDHMTKGMGMLCKSFKSMHPDLEAPGDEDMGPEAETSTANADDPSDVTEKPGGPQEDREKKEPGGIKNKSMKSWDFSTMPHVPVQRKALGGNAGGPDNADMPNQLEQVGTKGYLVSEENMNKVRDNQGWLTEHAMFPGHTQSTKSACLYHAKTMNEVMQDSPPTDGRAPAPEADELTGDNSRAQDEEAMVAKALLAEEKERNRLLKMYVAG